MPYDNRQRPGVRTSSTISPKEVLQDIDETIHILDPYATPLQTFGNYIGVGKPPKSHKIQVKEYDSFSNYDFCSAVTLGTAGEERFARLTLDQITRPTTSGSMYYYPQDKLHIVNTGQTLEVVMNERASMPISSTADITLSTTLTGDSATRSLNGTVVVRNIEPYPILSFTTSDVVFLGRTIYEGQDIEAEPKQRDFIYDSNIVEHKEAVIEMTEDQKYLVHTKGKIPDWDFQQKQNMREFKVDVDYNSMFSERAVDYTIPNKPKRHMRGLINAIKTNVSYYNPSTITDFELMFSNFMYEQAFAYNPNGQTTKLGLAGGRFLMDFNMAFRDYRRTSEIDKVGKKIGLDIQSYYIPGGQSINLVRSEALKRQTKLEYWCFVIDPKLMEWRIKKDYNTRDYSLANQRIEKIAIEWQGSIAWHVEQAHSLLRTV